MMGVGRTSARRVDRAMVMAAQSVMGCRFCWHGHSPQTGFDCVGLVWWTVQQQQLAPAPIPIVARRALHHRRTLYRTMRAAGLSRCQRRTPPAPGHIMLYRWPNGDWHMGIFASDHLIHAHHGIGRVVATPIAADLLLDGAMIDSRWRITKD